VDKSFLIQITNELYRLTLLFPKKEPLRYKMRELADDILAKLVENSSRPLFAELEVLDGFFEVAKNQNWVSPSEILKLQLDYSKVKLPTSPVGEQIPQNNNNTPPDARHQKILEVLKEKGKAQVWELKKIFPEITKRTLRRDFGHLLKRGAIERLGERNETFYQIKHL
jgi:hypothetical protein